MSGLLKHLPNILTGLRLLAAPMFAFLLLEAHDSAALGVFAFAGLSDAADGYLAKRFGLATRFGRYLDPAADKLLMLVAFVTLAATGTTPVWLTVLVIARDACIVLGVVTAKLFVLPLKVEPLPIGKFSTVVQVVYVALMLLILALDATWPQVANIAAILTGATTVASGLAYAQLWLKALGQSRSRVA